ncbi:glycosyltransferase family 2 protein [Leptolyngbya sp. FACHB-321]|uniref:glycosyltransferase family 2 protein n=1 Tax=Leptolyngbya sp. FACHB-321 TaxID=2692807 RepID=UPI001689D6C3|nr:glycosyltransferase family A protein [Leptolyngbya sp. FACHB-321]MBD2038537.1 glycosyltransferase family 2 protein [Leptolyngbya sp. FACHB-321]
MESTPLVSIIVTSYNYARYLRQAIDSALEQTYTNIEVIVVDDGSKDDSPNVIASYGDRIIPILKENGGQGSAWNTGFAAAKGEIVAFLDSDDVLLPDIIQRVVEAFKSHSGTAKVQYRLHLTDADCNLIGRTTPLMRRKMPTGDLRPKILKFPNYNWPPSSGNAFLAEALRQIMPVPEDTYRVSPDLYVNVLIPIMGSIASLEEPGALYRRHGKNNGVTTGSVVQSIDLVEFRRNLVNTAELHKKRKELVGDSSLNIEDRDSKFLIGRMVSKKVDRDNYPFKDNVFSICLNGIIACLVEPGLSIAQRLLTSIWFLAMLVAPKPLACQFANSFIFPSNRPPLVTKAITWARKMQRTRAQA